MLFIPLNVNHCFNLANLHQQNKYSHWSQNDYHDFFTKDQWKGVIGTGIFNNDNQNNLIGFILGRQTQDDNEIFITVVDEAYRNQGIGLKLLHHYINDLVTPCFLEVSVNNFAAIRLYKKADFATIAVRKNYYKLQHGFEDACVMQYSPIIENDLGKI